MASVSLPLWLFVPMLLMALLAACEWLLIPCVRWYFRRKVRRVIDEVNVRLNIDIPPFKLTRRKSLIERLLSDPKVLSAVVEQSRVEAVPQEKLLRRVHQYAREIVPAFNAYVYFRLGYRVAKGFARLIYRVRLGYTDGAAMAAINPNSTVVFVMNHRSNMDYLLVSFLVAEHVALSYAVGEWARIWPLQSLIRAMGAYFVRRNSGDALYRRCYSATSRWPPKVECLKPCTPKVGCQWTGAWGDPRWACSTTCSRILIPGANVTWCSSLWASTTTASSKTAACSVD